MTRSTTVRLCGVAVWLVLGCCVAGRGHAQDVASVAPQPISAGQYLGAAVVILGLIGATWKTVDWLQRQRSPSPSPSLLPAPSTDSVGLQLLRGELHNQCATCEARHVRVRATLREAELREIATTEAGVVARRALHSRLDAMVADSSARREASAREAGEMTAALRQAADQIDRLQVQLDALHSGLSR